MCLSTTHTGLRLDLGYTFDVSQAGILSYEDSYVDIYSNSWGPAETGFTVGGPGYLTLETFKRETKQVRVQYCISHMSRVLPII